MTKPERSKDTLKLISKVEKMLRELKAGYTPDYLLIIYPPMDNSGTDVQMGFTVDDAHIARRFHEHIELAASEFRQHFIVESLGLSTEDLNKARAQYKRDVEKAEERAYDLLKKDKPITDTKAAVDLLNKLMEKKNG